MLSRELDVNALVLGSENVDLRDVRKLKKLLSHFINGVPQLPVREPVRGKTVDDAIGIANSSLKPGPTIPWGSVFRMSPTFLRTWYQVPDA